MNLIDCSHEYMKVAIVGFVNIHNDGLVGINSFIFVIDTTKVVQGVIISYHHKTIVRGLYPNHFIYFEGMTKYEIYDLINLISSR